MHRSIIQNLGVKKCYLCGAEGPVEVHHCLHGTANRKLSEEDGLMVNLCPECHRLLHDSRNRHDDRKLMRMAQVEWMSYNMADAYAFIARYGKNYLEV